jgi:hypothetical protein
VLCQSVESVTPWLLLIVVVKRVGRVDDIATYWCGKMEVDDAILARAVHTISRDYNISKLYFSLGKSY